MEAKGSQSWEAPPVERDDRVNRGQEAGDKGEVRDASQEFCLSKKVPFTEMRKTGRVAVLGGYKELHRKHTQFENP